MKYWWKDPEWWNATLYLIFKATAQALIFAIGADQVGWFHHWYQIAATAATMALLTFLTAIILSPKGSVPILKE